MRHEEEKEFEDPTEGSHSESHEATGLRDLATKMLNQARNGSANEGSEPPPRKNVDAKVPPTPPTDDPLPKVTVGSEEQIKRVLEELKSASPSEKDRAAPKREVDIIKDGLGSEVFEKIRRKSLLHCPRKDEQSDERWLKDSIKEIAADLKDVGEEDRPLTRKEKDHIKNVMHDAAVLGIETQLVDGLNKALEKSKLSISYEMTKDERTIKVSKAIEREIFDSRSGPEITAVISIPKPENTNSLKPTSDLDMLKSQQNRQAEPSRALQDLFKRK